MIRRAPNRSPPVAARMTAAISGTTAMNNPVVELFSWVSA